MRDLLRSSACVLLLATVATVAAGCGGGAPGAGAPASEASASGAPASATHTKGEPAEAHAAHSARAGAAAGPEWAKVPLAEGAIASAQAATEVPPAFRNAAGQIACPVMGMAIDKPDDAVSYVDHAGVRYFMCCDSCEKLFIEDPETYADGRYLKDHDLDPTAPKTCGDAEG